MRASYSACLATAFFAVLGLSACGGSSSPTPAAAASPAPQAQTSPANPEPLQSQPPAAPPPASPEPPPAPPPPPPPAEPPPEPPPPPPPPPTPPDVPPLAATAINIDKNQLIGDVHWPNGNTSTGGHGEQVNGVPCGEMAENYHIHLHLAFFLDGRQLAVPQGIGSVEPRPGSHCYYSIHTHEMSGKIHVEAPEERVFTLGQLFAIWGQPLERTNLAGFTGLPVVVYVTDNGVAVKYDGDLKQIEFKSKRHVTIQIGTPIKEIPLYTWWGP